jgi:hypothetical protein
MKVALFVKEDVLLLFYYSTKNNVKCTIQVKIKRRGPIAGKTQPMKHIASITNKTRNQV